MVWKTSKEEDKDLKISRAWQEAEAYFSYTNLPNWFHLFQWQVTKNVHATVFISGKLICWITWRRLYQKLKWRGNHKTTWCLYLKILALYNTTEEDLFILQAFYFVMKSQNISFLLGNNLEYLKKILCLLVCHQECTKIFIPFASCSIITKCSFVCNFSYWSL